MPPTNTSERINRLLTELEQCKHAEDRLLMRETVRLLRDHLRQREEEYHRADDRFRLAVDAAQIGVWDWDIASGRVMWNSHHAHIFGIDPAHFEGDYAAFTRRVHPDDRPSLLAAIARAGSERSHFDHSYRVCWPDGSVRWVRSKGGYCYDAEGHAVRMSGTVVDITEQVEGSLLTESERRYRTLVENTDAVIARLDRELRHLFVNSAVEKITGLAPSRFIGKTNRELGMPEELCKFWENKCEQVFQTGKSLEFTFELPTLAGARLYRSRVAPECDESGIVESIVVIAHEVTEQVKIERERTALHQRLAALMDAVPVGVSFSDDSSCERITGNRELLRQLQARPEDNLSASASDAAALGRRVQFFHDGRLVSEQELPLQRAVSENAVIPPMELEVRMSDGRVWYCDASGAPIVNDGKVVGGVAVTVDITERRKAEVALRESAVRAQARSDELLALMEAVPAVTFVAHDRECTNMSGNRATRQLLRLPDHLSVSKSAPDNERPDNFKILKDGRQLEASELPVQVAALTGNEVRNVELTLEFDDGTHREIFGHAVPLFDSAGDIRGAVGAFIDITERKIAEETLREYAEMIDAAQDAVIVREVGGRITFWNHGAERIYGYSRHEAVGCVSHQLLSTVFTKPLGEIETTLLQQGFWEGELTHKTADGRIVMMNSRWILKRDVSRQIDHVMEINTDITERRRAAEVLRLSLEQMEVVVRGANVGVWYCPLPFDRLMWDATVKEHFHLAPEAEITINLFYERIHPDDRERTRCAIETSIEQRQPYDIVYRTVSPDGRNVKWIRATGRGFYDAGERPNRFDGIAIDVTRQKQDEERVREAAAQARASAEINAKFRTFFDQGTYFAGVMTLDGTLIEANRLSLEACGFRRDEVIGRKFWECGWWNRSELLMEMVKEGCRQALSGKTFRRETHYFLADGSQRFVELTLAPVKDDEGNVLFIAPTGVDITEKRQMSDHLRRLLASERAARDEAERANHTKDRFLAVLSHELRTPLSPVVMAIPAMEDDPDLPDKFRGDLNMIRRNIGLEVKLIDDLLDLSRVATGKLELNKRQVCVHEVIRYAIDNTMNDPAARLLEIHVDLSAAADRVMADPERLQQVLWNLLRNSVKFTPTGGRICIVTTNRDRKHITIEVKDSGIGISADVLPRIFDAFEQGAHEITKKFGGLGLGLAISKSLVELHEGVITAESEGANKGSSFTVTLPLTVAGQAASPQDRPEVLSRLNCSILLVEDHSDTVWVMTKLLERLGCTVKSASTAAMALRLAGDQRFDLVISDIGLPDATGMELMAQLKSRYKLKGIALSGYGMEEDILKSRAAGFSEHLVKPVDSKRLRAAIDAALYSSNADGRAEY